MFYAIVRQDEGITRVIGEAPSLRELLDGIKDTTADGDRIIITQQIKIMVPVTETVWKEVKGT